MPALSADRFALELIHSETGLLLSEGMFQRRILAKALAGYANKFDCIVIGSSHVMQISSFRNDKSLSGTCDHLINLGVSGASIEDHFALAFLSSKYAIPKTNFVLGIDPWTMSHNKDNRWMEYQADYEAARLEIIAKSGSKSKYKEDNKLSKLVNLLNIEYTERSMLLLKRRLLYGPPEIQEVIVEEEVGISNPVMLPDGSHIYSSDYIKKARNSPIPIGGSEYKTAGIVSSERGVKEYLDLLRWLVSKQYTPVILMTPYHHNVWKAHNSKNVVAMQKTEAIILSIGKELGIEVIGSYRPEMFGCREDEFYDFMHTKASCLAKLQSRSISSDP